jgi:hypothetical protein
MPKAALNENALDTSPSGSTALPRAMTHTPHMNASTKPRIPAYTSERAPWNSIGGDDGLRSLENIFDASIVRPKFSQV